MSAPLRDRPDFLSMMTDIGAGVKLSQVARDHHVDRSALSRARSRWVETNGGGTSAIAPPVVIAAPTNDSASREPTPDFAEILANTPKGWTPGVELEGDEGEICTGAVDGPIGDWAAILRLWNLDPEVFEVIEPALFKTWDSLVKEQVYVGDAPNGDPVYVKQPVVRRLYSYRARIKRIGPSLSVISAFDGLVKVGEEHGWICAGCGKHFTRSKVGTIWCSAKCRDSYKPKEFDDGVVCHVIIPDTQVDPDRPTDHLMWAGRYIREKYAGRPTKIISLMDHYNMGSLSSYDKGKKAAEKRRVREDIDAGKRGFEVLHESMGTDPLWEEHCTFGNHEDRVDRYCEDHPEIDGFLTMEHLWTPPGWQRHKFLEIAWIDGIAYSHYFYQPNTGRPYGGENIEARIKSVGHSFVMGHQQGLRMGMHYAAGTRRIGIVAGSFYQHDEGYKGPQGNNHWRGIVILNDVKDGSGDPMPVSIDYLCRRYEGHPISKHKGKVL